jgi:hypothetical protein
LCLLAAQTGCSSSNGVSGKVTYKGDLLRQGSVVFVADNGWTGSAPIQADGTYNFANVPPGTVKIAVDNFAGAEKRGFPHGKGVHVPSPLAKKPPEGVGQSPSESQPVYIPVKLPEKDKKAETSGLTYEVKRGRQTFDIRID